MIKTTLILAFTSFLISSCGGTSDTERSQKQLQTELNQVLNPAPKQNAYEEYSLDSLVEIDSTKLSE